MYNSPHVSGSFVPHGYPGPGNHPHPPQPCPPPYITNRAATTGRGVPWSTGLFKCRSDLANCIVTAICPCVTFGQIAEIVNRGEVSCCVSGTIYALLIGMAGLSCMYSCFFRSRLRGQYDLEESPVDDCLVHFCCETCALCQEYRELKNRGFDMGIGWQANMNRNNRGITMPPVAPGMTR